MTSPICGGSFSARSFQGTTYTIGFDEPPPPPPLMPPTPPPPPPPQVAQAGADVNNKARRTARGCVILGFMARDCSKEAAGCIGFGRRCGEARGRKARHQNRRPVPVVHGKQCRARSSEGAAEGSQWQANGVSAAS